MGDIDNLAERIHSISTSKGFTPPDLENLPEKLMLSVSELAEALEEHRAGRPLVWFEHKRDARHADVELPEITIDSEGSWYFKRVEKDVDDWAKDYLARGGTESDMTSNGLYQVDGRWKNKVTERVPFVVEEWAAKGAYDAKPEGILVEVADSIIRNLHIMHSIIEQERYDYTITEILELKIDYNDTRPAMHGKSY